MNLIHHVSTGRREDEMREDERREEKRIKEDERREEKTREDKRRQEKKRREKKIKISLTVAPPRTHRLCPKWFCSRFMTLHSGWMLML